MSPRRVAIQRLGLAVSILAVVLAGCIFDPKSIDKPPCDNCSGVKIPTNEPELIANLALAYQHRNYDEFANLLPTAENNVQYFFFLSAPLEDGTTNWGATEELRIHRRMFNPENPLPGETPVPQELWLQSITISLTPIREFVERPDLYASQTNPSGLDPAKWKVTEAEYHAEILFDTQTETDYRVDGKANFIVINDLTKTAGQDRKFLIYRWEDLGTYTPKPTAPAI